MQDCILDLESKLKLILDPTNAINNFIYRFYLNYNHFFSYLKVRK